MLQERREEWNSQVTLKLNLIIEEACRVDASAGSEKSTSKVISIYGVHFHKHFDFAILQQFTWIAMVWNRPRWPESTWRQSYPKSLRSCRNWRKVHLKILTFQGSVWSIRTCTPLPSKGLGISGGGPFEDFSPSCAITKQIYLLFRLWRSDTKRTLMCDVPSAWKSAAGHETD